MREVYTSKNSNNPKSSLFFTQNSYEINSDLLKSHDNRVNDRKIINSSVFSEIGQG